MSRTPDVVTDGVAQASWANEIRDRTVQQFASKAELDGWLAPNGSVGVVAGSTVWIRRAGAWVAALTGGKYWSGATNDQAQIIIPHGYPMTPTWAVVTPRYGLSTTFTQAVVTGISATNVSVRCRNYAGVSITLDNVDGYMVVGV